MSDSVSSNELCRVQSDNELKSNALSSTPVADITTVDDSSQRLEKAIKCLNLLDRVWPNSPAGVTDVLAHLRLSELENSVDTYRLGRFQILEELGRGGGGIVYRARDPRLNRDVALKIPALQGLAIPDVRRRFVRESQLAARLNHPNLVAVYEVGEDGPVCFIASELCRGKNLSQWLKNQTEPVPVMWAAECTAVLARATDYMHSRDILHRDLKPSNVLLANLDQGARDHDDASQSVHSAAILSTPSFIPKIGDFGLAKDLFDTPQQTKTGTLLGTPSYMAPEQVRGDLTQVGPRTDVYALGCILYELLAGQPPYVGYSDIETLRQIVSRQPISPSRLRADVPRDLESICLKCLEHDPAQRYESAGDLASDLVRFQKGQPVTAHRPSAIARVWKWSARHPVTAGLIATVVACVLLGTALTGMQWRRTEWQRQRAQNNLRLALQAVRDMHDVNFEEGNDAVQFHPLNKQLLQLSIDYYLRLQTQDDDELGIMFNLADAYLQIGYISQVEGYHVKAGELYEKSLPLWSRLARADPLDAEYQRGLAKAHHCLGTLSVGENRAAKMAHLQRACEIAQRLETSHPGTYNRDLAVNLKALAGAYRDAGRIADAILQAQFSTTLYEEMIQDEDLTQAQDQQESTGLSRREQILRKELAESYLLLADMHLELDDRDRCLHFCHQARELQTELVRYSIDWAADLAQTLHFMANLQSDSGAHTQAIETYDKARQLLNSILEEYPDHGSAHRKLAYNHTCTGNVKRMISRFDQALEHHWIALEMHQQTVRQNPGALPFQLKVVNSYELLAKDYSGCDRPDQAALCLRQANELCTELAEAHQGDARLSTRTTRVQRRLADVEQLIQSGSQLATD